METHAVVTPKHLNIVETRRKNLRVLAKMRPGGQKELGLELGFSESRMSQMIGKNPIRPVTEKVAMFIEDRLGYADGWLSEERPDVWINYDLSGDE